MVNSHKNSNVVSELGEIPMAKRSEGVKRLTLLISILSCIGWILFVAIGRGFSNFHDRDWFIAIGGLIAAFFIPQLIRIIAYWVIDGFKKDKKT